MRRYILLVVSCIACAAAIMALAWRVLPPHGHWWNAVLCFAIYTTIAELLAVVTDEGQGVTVSPTSPILWAATCVLGPAPAIVVCAVFSSVTLLIRGVCHRVSPAAQALLDGPSAGDWLVSRVSRSIVALGAAWRSRGTMDTALYLGYYVSSGAIVVGTAGLVYHFIGGVFLFESGQINVIRQFAAPFIGLWIVAVAAEHAIYIAFMIAMNPPLSGKGSVYAVLLRVKLLVIEDVIPVWKGQMFLVVVAWLISYLYMYLGVWGFVLTAMPVLALRDFFRHWVDEQSAYLNTITTLATYMQHYHPYTRGHLKRVADLSGRLARELRLPAESIRYINTAGFLHDIGKIAVSEEILDKTSKLTDDEWGQIREHPVKGAEIISHIEFLEGIADWIRYHHKWHNGSGYPATNGDACVIPIEAAIIAAVDAFDAMTDDREMTVDWTCDSCGYHPEDGSRPEKCPVCGMEKRRTYREPKSLDEAIEELRRGAGSQFEPRVVKAFLTMIERDGISANG